MRLSLEQKREFHDTGYLVLPGAVSAELVGEARHAINHSLGEVGMSREDLPAMRAQTYCREIRETAAVTDLVIQSTISPLVESMLGPGNLVPPSGGQIALRFPLPPGTDPGPPRGHLDGLGSGQNGMEKGVYRRGFTVLAVVLLSELPRADSGNFTVWPRSHRFFEEYFQREGHELLADGMPKVELPGGPRQITGSRGDVVLAHHQLVHTAAPNASADIRYAAIFRLRHRDCEAVGLDAYVDIWREWPGIREAGEHGG